MITLIARHLGVDFDGLEPMRDRQNIVDFAELMRTNMFIKAGDYIFSCCGSLNAPYLRLSRPHTSPLHFRDHPRDFYVLGDGVDDIPRDGQHDDMEEDDTFERQHYE